MSIFTTYRDNEHTGYREAWQNGKHVYKWTRQEIEAMHQESPETVWAWGKVPFERKHKKSNAEVKGGCASK